MPCPLPWSWLGDEHSDNQIDRGCAEMGAAIRDGVDLHSAIAACRRCRARPRRHCTKAADPVCGFRTRLPGPPLKYWHMRECRDGACDRLSGSWAAARAGPARVARYDADVYA